MCFWAQFGDEAHRAFGFAMQCCIRHDLGEGKQGWEFSWTAFSELMAARQEDPRSALGELTEGFSRAELIDACRTVVSTMNTTAET